MRLARTKTKDLPDEIVGARGCRVKRAVRLDRESVTAATVVLTDYEYCTRLMLYMDWTLRNKEIG